jgi:hypothetical protein
MRNKLLSYARKARRWAERLEEKECEEYDCFPRDLGGYCVIASIYLYKLLRDAGLNPRVIFNEDHAFVVCQGYLIDVTATQFNFCFKNDELATIDDPHPKVECFKIVPRGRHTKCGIWKLKGGIQTPRGILNFMEKHWEYEPHARIAKELLNV